jgi:predicted ester cyclase
MGISPTGNEIAIGVIFICRIIEGKIVEVWGEADLLGLMQQLGMELKPKEAEK